MRVPGCARRKIPPLLVAATTLSLILGTLFDYVALFAIVCLGDFVLYCGISYLWSFVFEGVHLDAYAPHGNAPSALLRELITVVSWLMRSANRVCKRAGSRSGIKSGRLRRSITRRSRLRAPTALVRSIALRACACVHAARACGAICCGGIIGIVRAALNVFSGTETS